MKFVPKRQNHYSTNKTGVYYIDHIWSLDILDLKEYGPEKHGTFCFILVVIDKFSKLGWTLPLKNKTAQTIKDSIGNILLTSKRKPNIIETDRGKELYNSIFQNFSNNNNIKLFSRNTSVEAVFAEIFNQTIRDFLKRPVFEKADSKWVDMVSTIMKQYINRVHSSTKLTLI